MIVKTPEEAFKAGWEAAEGDRMSDTQRARLLAILAPHVDLLFGDEDERGDAA